MMMSVEQLLLVMTTIGAGIAWAWNASQNRIRVRVDEITAQMVSCEKERIALTARVAAIESAIGEDMPTWRRTGEGTVLSVSRACVRLFFTPHRLGASDIIGKRFDDLGIFSDELLTTLNDMDAEAIMEGHAVRHGVEITPGRRVTIIKVTAYSEKNETVFIAAAAPERV